VTQGEKGDVTLRALMRKTTKDAHRLAKASQIPLSYNLLSNLLHHFKFVC